jgi:hypothetical protein
MSYRTCHAFLLAIALTFGGVVAGCSGESHSSHRQDIAAPGDLNSVKVQAKQLKVAAPPKRPN